MSCRNHFVLSLIFSCTFSAQAAFLSFEEVKANYLSSESQILDRHGRALQDLRIHQEFRRLKWFTIDQISQPLKDMVIQAEDKRFYSHHGVDWRALLNGALSPFAKRARGASTISMQTLGFLESKFKRGTRPRNFREKFSQINAAKSLESEWTKNEILESYLNFVSFRGELQGVGAASFGLFGKTPDALSLHESAILAALIRSPNSEVSQVSSRACAQYKVYLKALKREFDECDSIAQLAFLALSSAPRGRGDSLVAREAPELARVLFQKGDKNSQIKSTLDYELQKFSREALVESVFALKNQNVHDGAVLVVDHQNNEVLAYVANTGQNYVDGIQAKRQAGSTLKPFLYGLAIEKKYLTQSSLLEDSPIDIAVLGGMYRPLNYDKTFHGIVPLRKALGSSLNVPAVKTLLLTGIEPFHRLLESLKIQNLQTSDFYGPSLALGSVDLSLFELVQAYSMLARGGRMAPIKASPDHEASWEKVFRGSQRIFSKQAAYIVSDMISSNENREMGFGTNSPLDFKFWVASKTGTSKDMRDNWCVGYSDRFTVGIWIGNFNGEPMYNVTGMSGAAPLFAKVMGHLHRSQGSKAPKLPSGVVLRDVADTAQRDFKSRLSYIKGTEPELGTQIQRVEFSSEAPKILYPIKDLMVALDPDIPELNQKVVFESNSSGREMAMLLNGLPLLRDEFGQVAWSPKLGTHRLALHNEKGLAVDEIQFFVRGSAHSTEAAEWTASKLQSEE